MNPRIVLVPVLAFACLVCSPVVAEDVAQPPAEEALPTNLVARVGSVDVPYEWFLHEFRSTFFRFGPQDNIRQIVFSNMVERMTIYAAAVESGITNDVEVMAKVESDLVEMRRFLEFQMAMARMGLITEAYLAKEGVDVSADDLKDEDVNAYYEENVAGMTGAPATFDDVPAEIQAQIRNEMIAAKNDEMVQALLERVRTNIPVRVNLERVDSVPMPKMEGDVPPEFRGQMP